jgi:soluble lytic murein transglycosylase-like protein
VNFPRLIIPALLLSASLPGAPKSLPQPETNSFAAQLASVNQQMLSIEVQRKVIAKQETAFRRTRREEKPVVETLGTEALNLECGALAPRETERLVETAARKQSVSPELLRAVIRQESAFRPCAVSEKGAQGLMQLMPATAAAFNVNDPFDPQQNVLGGAAYLRQLMERYSGDASLALSAYNAGPQVVDRIAGIPNIPETQNYVTSIFRDLGWTLPARPAVMAGTGWEQPEMEADVRPDTADQDLASSEITAEPKASEPVKEKPAIAPRPLP